MGYFKLERGWSDHIVFDNEPLTQREAWVWLIEHAAWRDTTMSVGRDRYQVCRGQLAASVRYLALRWQWSKSRVARFLNRLKSETMIGTEERQHASIITICNYAKYQDERDSDGTDTGTATGTEAGQQRDSSGTKKKAIKEDTNNEAEEEAMALSAWQVVAGEHGLAKVSKLTKTRRVHLKARLADCGGLDGWLDALKKIRGSPFMLGKNDRGWKVDFDFLLKEQNFTKLMEGKYDGGSRVQGSKSGELTGFAAVAAELASQGGFGRMDEAGEFDGEGRGSGEMAPARGGRAFASG